MRRNTLSKRFSVHIGRADGGRSFVRVYDTVTGLSKTQVGFDGESTDAITKHLASQIIYETNTLIKIAHIISVDIIRDGGSYSLCFYSTDGDWYEFFIPIKFDGDVATGYETPRLYFHSFNDCNVVRTFAWEEAQQFVAPLSFDNARFHELVHIVQTREHFPPGAINS